MNKYIFLNPEGIQKLGLVVIVQANTGVTYAHQCGGTSNEIFEIEGFAVPIGDCQTTGKLLRFFWKFKGNPPSERTVNPWNDAELKHLKYIVEGIPFWKTYKDVKDELAFLELDTERLEELTEAWVPVKTVYGSGVLVFDSSD